MPLAAVCQMSSGPDKAQNVALARELVSRAAAMGASFVALPENFELMASSQEKREQAEPLDGPTLTSLRELARALGITLLAGSLAERAEGGKVHNTSVLVGPDGRDLAVYRKIHLFDVDIRDGATYRESELVVPGSEAVTGDSPQGRVGLSVCYDLRFPELYRRLSRAGAEILTVPAAFTLLTGKDHWEVLLRARAIENQCFVVAAAQHGSHPGNRLTYGHSMIVDPWGIVLACCADGSGVALAELDRAALARIRKQLPALEHRRLE
ncbi:MAG TPA: carbon-nitrogen hydrolase family protein [Myxococcales bacterium]|nr:carbon-nitrogen hydrolase family protein [Myxococcales bacterium]